ncbi:MAG: hypothetical protein U0232_26925 [Thermomicrobiales bacterium]
MIFAVVATEPDDLARIVDVIRLQEFPSRARGYQSIEINDTYAAIGLKLPAHSVIVQDTRGWARNNR